MTYISKFSGDITRPIVAAYTCPDHGEFDATVERAANGGAPDVAECPYPNEANGEGPCPLAATWTPSPVACRVRRVEVVRGKYEHPERPTYLDTRNLGEGQDIDDFREDRRKIWDEKRKAEVMKMVRE